MFDGTRIETRINPKIEAITASLAADFNIDNDFDSSSKEGVPEAIKLGQERSPHNVKRSLQLYLESVAQKKEDLEIARKQLLAEVEAVQASLRLVHNANALGALRRLKSGTIKSIFDVSQKQAQQKHGRDDWAGYTHRRKETEQALGWKEGENPCYLAVEDRTNDDNNGAAAYWGSVRFIMDFDSLKDKSTFTESDSMNIGGLPEELRGLGKNSTDKKTSTQNRQIAADHVAIVKAIFNLLAPTEKQALIKDLGKAQLRDLGYIEAQVGGGLELNESLQTIDIDLVEFKKEIERGFSKWAQEEAYQEAEPEIGWEEYHKKKRRFNAREANQDDPRYRLRLSPTQIQTRIHELLNSKIQTALQEIQLYCDKNEIALNLRNDEQ